MSHIEQIQTPEAGALLSISRCTGSVALFASDMDHQHFISLKIKPATTHRSLARTWYMGNLVPYVEIHLSASQFAEAITSLNVGSGVPCTMKHLNGRDFPNVAPVDERPKFEAEGSQAMNDSISAIDEAISALDGLKLSAKARAEVEGKMRSARRKLDDTMPFLVKQYHEHLDDADQKSKTEIAAYIDHAIHQYGAEALAANKVEPKALT